MTARFAAKMRAATAACVSSQDVPYSRKMLPMGEAPANQFRGYVPLGPKPYLDRFMIEYRLTGVELHNKTRRRRASFRIGDETFDVEYLVHECLLRSHGEFRCAGDEEALQFCRDTADEMVSLFGMTRDEAVVAINRQWSDAEPAGRMPRVWIVGLDIVYHETPEYWAERIFRSHASS